MWRGREKERGQVVGRWVAVKGADGERADSRASDTWPWQARAEGARLDAHQASSLAPQRILPTHLPYMVTACPYMEGA